MSRATVFFSKGPSFQGSASYGEPLQINFSFFVDIKIRSFTERGFRLRVFSSRCRRIGLISSFVQCCVAVLCGSGSSACLASAVHPCWLNFMQRRLCNKLSISLSLSRSCARIRRSVLLLTSCQNFVRLFAECAVSGKGVGRGGGSRPLPMFVDFPAAETMFFQVCPFETG